MRERDPGDAVAADGTGRVGERTAVDLPLGRGCYVPEHNPDEQVVASGDRG